MKKLKIIHVISSTGENYGGTSKVFNDLKDYQMSKGFNILVVSKISDLIQINSIKDKSGCVLHIHGVWSLIHYFSIFLAKKNNIPYIIQPHGMLMAEPLKRKFLKKFIALFVYQRKDLMRAKLLIATSSSEYDYLRFLKFLNPIAIIPNGIKKNSLNFHREKKTDIHHNQINFLFLSRIHPIKGLINLINAWALINQKKIKLKIVGPDEDNYLGKLRYEINRLDLNESIQIFPAAYGKEKEIFFQESDFFILPSISENFGIAILEALSYGIPVITTKGTPWSELQTQGGGWWIDNSIDALVGAINEAISLSSSELKLMKLNARRISSNYYLDHSVKKVFQSYLWAINSIDKPDFIYLD